MEFRKEDPYPELGSNTFPITGLFQPHDLKDHDQRSKRSHKLCYAFFCQNIEIKFSKGGLNFGYFGTLI